MVFGVLRPDPGGKVRWGAPTAPDKDEPTSYFSNRKTERKGGSGGVPNRAASGTGEGETLLHGNTDQTHFTVCPLNVEYCKLVICFYVLIKKHCTKNARSVVL